MKTKAVQHIAILMVIANLFLGNSLTYGDSLPDNVINAKVGEDVSLSCPFQKSHVPVFIQLSHLKDDQVVCQYNHEKKKVEKCDQHFCNRTEVSEKTGNILIKINLVTLSDSGKYRCKIINGGISNVIMELKVSDVGTTTTSRPWVMNTKLELNLLKNQHGMTTEQHEQKTENKNYKVVITVILIITATVIAIGLVLFIKKMCKKRDKDMKIITEYEKSKEFSHSPLLSIPFDPDNTLHPHGVSKQRENLPSVT